MNIFMENAMRDLSTTLWRGIARLVRASAPLQTRFDGRPVLPGAACTDRWPYAELLPRLGAVLAILSSRAASSSLLVYGAPGPTPPPAT